MLKKILLRFRDMKTIKQLILGAEEQANIGGEEKPGAEHYVLSALNLEEGSARRVFERIGVDSDMFREAIKRQYTEALNAVGIREEAIEIEPEPIESNMIFHSSQSSGQELMKSLYALKQEDKNKPLLGVHVIRVVSEIEYGVTARAFREMGIDREQLAKAVRDELDSIQ